MACPLRGDQGTVNLARTAAEENVSVRLDLIAAMTKVQSGGPGPAVRPRARPGLAGGTHGLRENAAVSAETILLLVLAGVAVIVAVQRVAARTGLPAAALLT